MQDKKPYLSIPDWDKLQHYKDRTPPWIKLHNELLESYEFECLPDASKAHLLCIWLLASRTGNKINPDPRWIGRKIGANSKVDIDALIESGFLQLNQPLQTVEQDASKMLQTVEQDAIPEREGEKRESREEESKDITSGKPDNSVSKIDYSVLQCTSEEIKEIKRIRRANKGGAITQRVANALAKEFNKALDIGYSLDECLNEWEVRGWKSFKAEWLKPKPGTALSQYSEVTRQNIENLKGW